MGHESLITVLEEAMVNIETFKSDCAAALQRGASEDEKKKIIEDYFNPFYLRVKDQIGNLATFEQIARDFHFKGFLGIGTPYDMRHLTHKKIKL